MKELDLTQSLLVLTTKYPEIKELMYQLGFEKIVQPGMLQSAGRYMTIPKGAKMKKIPLAEIIQKFEAAGFTIKERNLWSN
ncbi:MAG: DUF1858 domain-containing protein [Enterococcus sp.]